MSIWFPVIILTHQNVTNKGKIVKITRVQYFNLKKVYKNTNFFKDTSKILLFLNKYNLIQNGHKTSLIKFDQF